MQSRSAQSAVSITKVIHGLSLTTSVTSSFSICQLDKLADLLGRKWACSGPDYKALSNLHCVDYADMGPELTMQVRQKSVEILGLVPTVVDAEFKEARREPMHKPAKRLRLAFWRSA